MPPKTRKNSKRIREEEEEEEEEEDDEKPKNSKRTRKEEKTKNSKRTRKEEKEDDDEKQKNIKRTRKEEEFNKEEEFKYVFNAGPEVKAKSLKNNKLKKETKPKSSKALLESPTSAEEKEITKTMTNTYRKKLPFIRESTPTASSLPPSLTSASLLPLPPSLTSTSLTLLPPPPVEKLKIVKSSRQEINFDNLKDFKNFIDIISDELNLKMSNEFDDRCNIYVTMINELSEDTCLKDYTGSESSFSIVDCYTFIGKFPINNPDIEYDKNIHIPKKDYICYDYIFSKIKEDTTQSDLESKYNGDLNGLYLKHKFYLDGCDIIHDVVRKGKYIEKLIEIEHSYSDNKIIKEFPLSNTVYDNNKIKKFRNDKVIELKEEINVPFSLTQVVDGKVGKRITREEGFIYFFKEIAKVYDKYKNLNQPFTYRESGRELSLKKLVEYYKGLKSEEKEKFEKNCKSNDDDNSAEKFLVYFKNNIIHSSIIQELEMEKYSISSFDACKQTMCSNPNLTKNRTIFSNVYGRYDYFLYSDTSIQKPIHVVIVRDFKTNDLVAIFLIEGDVSINFLLEENKKIFSSELEYDIEYTRKKSKISSASFINNSEIVDILIKILDILLKYGWCNNRNEIGEILDNLSNKGYYFLDTNDNKTNQLILLGNKTIGDLIFTSDLYKKCNESDDKIKCQEKIYSISTTDSFIWASVLYNYLCGKSNILQSVWQKDSGGGWIYAEGIFSQSKDSRTKYFLLQSASILAFIRYYIEYMEYIKSGNNENFDEKIRKIEISIEINNLKKVCKNILKYVFKIDDDIKNRTMLNIILNELPFNRVGNSLDYFFKFDFNFDIIDNPYEYLSSKMISQEFKYKKILIQQYINNIIKINENFDDSNNFNYDNLFKIFNSLYKLSNMFYINTISVYKNNLEKIKNFINVPRSDEKLFIFKINPNMEKIINKQQYRNIIQQKKTTQKGKKTQTKIQTQTQTLNHMNLEIVNKYNDDEQIELLLNSGYLQNNGLQVYNVLTMKTNSSSFPSGVYGSIKNDLFGYRIPINNSSGYRIGYDETFLYKYDESNNIKLSEKYQDNKQYIINNYLIPREKLDIYYELVNNTLNYSSLEIIIFSKIILTSTQTSNEEKNIRKLGGFITNTETRSKTDMHIYLWNVSNTTGNLIKLLELETIKSNILSSTLIITKILKNFKTIMLDYETDDSSDIDTILASSLFDMKNGNMEINNNIFFNTIKDNINSHYSKDSNPSEDRETFISKVKDLYLNYNDINSSVFLLESNENDDEDEEDEDGDSKKSKRGGQKMTKKKKYIKKRKQTKKRK